MAATYDLISSQILTGTTSTLTFNNFGGYTDLIIKGNYIATGDTFLRFNGDSGTYLFLSGTTGRPGSTQAFVSAQSNVSSIPLAGTPNSIAQSVNPNSFEVGIPSYTNSITKNGYLTLSYVTDSGVPRANTGIGAWQWRNTSAITSLTISASNNITGVISLYGILAGNA